jgi:outer membrane receptor for Fe3+-dicitrate
MKRYLIAAAIALTTSQVSAMDSLTQFHWVNRVLILNGSADSAAFEQQVAVLKSRSNDLAERDMVVLHVSDDEVRTIYGAAQKVDADALKSQAQLSGSGFQVVLVGKDGGVKLRSNTAISDVELFDIIDRMPMRQAEND